MYALLLYIILLLKKGLEDFLILMQSMICLCKSNAVASAELFVVSEDMIFGGTDPMFLLQKAGDMCYPIGNFNKEKIR